MKSLWIVTAALWIGIAPYAGVESMEPEAAPSEAVLLFELPEGFLAASSLNSSEDCPPQQPNCNYCYLQGGDCLACCFDAFVGCTNNCGSDPGCFQQCRKEARTCRGACPP